MSPGAGASEGGGQGPAALFCPRATEKAGACGRPGPAQREPRAAPGFRAASNETGRRPTTGRGPRRQPPANTNGGEGPRAGAGQGRAAAMGRGRPGRASTGPACTRPAAYLSWPSPPPLGAGGPPPRGRPRPQGAPAPETAAGPRGPGAAAYGAGAIPPGRGAASAAKKMPGGLPPRLDTTGRKKCGEDTLSPPLAVTADTRYPPVRRSSPKRTRCRLVPYALAVRRLLGLRSCVP